MWHSKPPSEEELAGPPKQLRIIWLEPFLDAAETIERCRLTTDLPALLPNQERGAGPARVEAADDTPREDKPGICPVVLTGQKEKPIVLGKEKAPLTPVRYDVVKALVDAWPGGLTKDHLDTKSGHPDARKRLKALAESDKDWNSVIKMAEVTGGGYRIK